MAGTVERPIPQTSTPPPAERGSVRWLLPLSAALATLAGVGLAYQMFTGQDRGPSAPPVDNAPISDTLKPPADSDGQLGVVMNPNPETQINPVDEAIKAGKIELNGAQDWEKYFTMITAQEGRTMLATAKERGEFKYLLPFDPRGQNVTLENFTIINRQGISFTYLGVKNLPSGRDFYSSIDGNGFIGQSGNRDSSGQFVATEFNPRISNNDMQMNVYAPLDITLTSPFKEQKVAQSVGISIGNPMFSFTPSTIERNNQKYNAVLYIAGGPVVQKLDGILLKTDNPNDVQKLQFNGADMKNLLTKGSKIAVVEKTN